MLRRNFLAGAVATVAPLNSGPGSVTNTEEQAGSLRSVTAGFRRLDATVPARQLIDPVRAHLRLVQELAQGTGDREQRGRLAAAGSELASFAAWLSWDMADLGSARVWYGTAIGSARRAGDPVLSAYQAGSLAQLEVSSGNPAEATALLRGARRSLGQGLSAIADAWLSSLEAQALAASGNEVEAGRALVASASAAERIPGEDPAPWPWVFAFDEAKVAAARIACGVHLGRPDWVFDALRAAEPAIRSGHAKQRALLMLDIADAHLESGHVDTAFACADQAVETGIEYRSGRVIDRARRLRRRVSMTMPPRAVRRFDDRLHGVHM
ncbi:hypothetical protein GTZ85_47180 [Streptomyces sp. SID5474]|nr:hypothetical protein [Streptomyces sp. SID5474]